MPHIKTHILHGLAMIRALIQHTSEVDSHFANPLGRLASAENAEAIQSIRQRVREGFARNRDFEQGKAMAVRDKIALALGRAAEVGADDQGGS